MEKKSKKELRSALQGSMTEAITKLELPAPTKRIQKLIDKNAKKLAAAYNELLKKEEKKRKKAEKFLHDAINGSGGKKKKDKSLNRLQPVEL